MIGEYPCCGEGLAIQMPSKTPVYFKEECPHCGETVWHKLSRVDPMSWTEDEFLKEFEVNYDTKIISNRKGKE